MRELVISRTPSHRVQKGQARPASKETKPNDNHKSPAETTDCEAGEEGSSASTACQEADAIEQPISQTMLGRLFACRLFAGGVRRHPCGETVRRARRWRGHYEGSTGVP